MQESKCQSGPLLTKK